jgi:hypothetical protein
MTHEKKQANHPDPQHHNNEEGNLQGYPIYPASEDIYNRFLEERDINPEDIAKTKDPDEVDDGIITGKGMHAHLPGSDLDIPGSELDDDQENIGGEDEENNFYSLGGDGHNDLDENS